jgi:hypothetical protein
MSNKHKKPWEYMTVTGGVSEDGEEFPPSKARKQFKLPWRVTGTGLKNITARQSSGKFIKLTAFILLLCACENPSQGYYHTSPETPPVTPALKPYTEPLPEPVPGPAPFADVDGTEYYLENAFLYKSSGGVKTLIGGTQGKEYFFLEAGRLYRIWEVKLQDEQKAFHYFLYLGSCTLSASGYTSKTVTGVERAGAKEYITYEGGYVYAGGQIFAVSAAGITEAGK